MYRIEMFCLCLIIRVQQNKRVHECRVRTVPLFLSFGQVVNFLSYVFLTFAFPNNLVELLVYFLVTATFLLHLSLILATFMLL